MLCLVPVLNPKLRVALPADSNYYQAKPWASLGRPVAAQPTGCLKKVAPKMLWPLDSTTMDLQFQPKKLSIRPALP